MPHDPRRNPEEDVPLDTGVAANRDTGGEPDPDAPDQHSTTGTTPNETFVGRVSGDDTGGAEESGAERRAGQQDATGDPSRSANEEWARKRRGARPEERPQGGPG